MGAKEELVRQRIAAEQEVKRQEREKKHQAAQRALRERQQLWAEVRYYLDNLWLAYEEADWSDAELVEFSRPGLKRWHKRRVETLAMLRVFSPHFAIRLYLRSDHKVWFLTDHDRYTRFISADRWIARQDEEVVRSSSCDDVTWYGPRLKSSYLRDFRDWLRETTNLPIPLGIHDFDA